VTPSSEAAKEDAHGAVANIILDEVGCAKASGRMGEAS
jgi:hypothetical protein